MLLDIVPLRGQPRVCIHSFTGIIGIVEYHFDRRVAGETARMVGHAPSFLIGALLLELDMPPRLLGFASSPRSLPPLLVCRALLSCE